MEDEYGEMDDSGETFVAEDFVLENGFVLPLAELRYRSFGELNARKDNCMVVCHALTGNAAVDEWWSEIFGEGKLLDPTRYCVVCCNVLGSCYGSSGPMSINPSTGLRWGSAFPDTTIRDSVRLQVRAVKERVGARGVACVVGGSMGGMQVLEWGAICGPEYVRSIIPICCGAYHHAWQIGISEAQRQAIYADPNWCGGDYAKGSGKEPFRGLSVARQIAMFTYRSPGAYSAKFGRRPASSRPAGGEAADRAAGGGGVVLVKASTMAEAADHAEATAETLTPLLSVSAEAASSAVPFAALVDRDEGRGFKGDVTGRRVTVRAQPAAVAGAEAGPAVASGAQIPSPAARFSVEKYLRYQGEKFLSRFDALSYVMITRQMDTHDLGRGRGGVRTALAGMTMPALVVSVSSDALYPPEEQHELRDLLPNAEFLGIESPNGHDGFLLDYEVMMPAAMRFLDNIATAAPADSDGLTTATRRCKL